MRRMFRPLIVLAVAGLATALSPGAATAAPAPQGAMGYEVVTLGTLGGRGSFGQSLNEHGDVVGDSGTANYVYRPFLWHDGVMTDLGSLEPGYGEFGGAADVNNHGVVVGVSDIYSGTLQRAFVWRNGTMRDLGTPAGLPSWASAVNDRGQVAGTMMISGSESRAFVWDRGRVEIVVQAHSHGLDINSRGQVVGTMLSAGRERAFLAFRGTVTDLGSAAGSDSGAAAINDFGWVVGHTTSALHPGNRAAFLWRNGTMTELPTLGGTYGDAFSVNNRGEVLGLTDDANGQFHYVLWRGGVPVDLKPYGIYPGGSGSGTPRRINDRGDLAGVYYSTEGASIAALFRRTRG